MRLRWVVRALWKRRISLLALWGIVAAVGFAWVSSRPAVYRAEAVVLVESSRVPERLVPPTMGAEFIERFNAARLQLLAGAHLLGMIQQHGLYGRQRRAGASEQELIEQMRKDIQITPVGARGTIDPGTFRVSYQGPSPAVAAEVANELTRQLIGEASRARQAQAAAASEFLDARLGEAEQELEEREQALADFRTRHHGELPEQENTLTATLNRLHGELASVQDNTARLGQERVMLVSALAGAQASEAAMVRAAERSVWEKRLSAGRQAQTRERELEGRLAGLRALYTDQHPDVQRARSELARAEARQEDASARLQDFATSSDGDSPGPELAPAVLKERERVESLRSRLGVLEEQQKLLSARRSRVAAEIEFVLGCIERLPLRRQEMNPLVRDYEMANAGYQSLVSKKVAAEMAVEMERQHPPERLTVLDEARVPLRPVTPLRTLFYAASLLGGLLVSGLVAVGREAIPQVKARAFEPLPRAPRHPLPVRVPYRVRLRRRSG